MSVKWAVGFGVSIEEGGWEGRGMEEARFEEVGVDVAGYCG